MNHILEMEVYYIYEDGCFKELYRGNRDKCLQYVKILNKYLDRYCYILDWRLKRI